MRYIDLLTDSFHWKSELLEFQEELDRIDAMHRYIVTVSRDQFGVAYERLLSENFHPDASYDGSDAIYDAEELVGINPWEVSSHAGLMAITRGVSLAEVMMARMAAAHFQDPSHWTYPNDSLWHRSWEELFYKAVPLKAFNTSGNGFGALRQLRDLYVHGYGIPITTEKRNQLARKLYGSFPPTAPTDKEVRLGYSMPVYFFGEDTRFSSQTKSLEAGLLSSMRADVSPLATFRALERIRDHVQDASATLQYGIRSDTTPAIEKFISMVTHWWDRQKSR